MNKTYRCFSPALFLFLLGKDIKPIMADVHHVSGRRFAVFVMDQDLSDALTEWSAFRINDQNS